MLGAIWGRMFLWAMMSGLAIRSASIGANATIVCGTTLGRNAFVGAGSTVTKDVPDYAVVVADAAICMCWAHARRKFVDAIPQGVENISSTIAAKAIRQIDALFKLEKDWKGLSAEERQEQRQAEARPLIDAL